MSVTNLLQWGVIAILGVSVIILSYNQSKLIDDIERMFDLFNQDIEDVMEAMDDE